MDCEMDRLIKILKDINPDVDYPHCTTLVDDEIFTSFELVNVVTRICEEFAIQIFPEQIIPGNFNSADSIYRLIQKLEEDV